MIFKSHLVTYVDGLSAADAIEVTLLLNGCRDKMAELGRDETARLIGEAVLKIVDVQPTDKVDLGS